jgi:tetratricopeptide (TPR) repeat protein
MTVTKEKFSWYQADSEVKKLLVLAADNWENTDLAEQYIKEALFKAGNNLDVLIGAYRFFFYKSNPVAALQIAQQVLEIVRQKENLPTEWEQLQAIINSRKNEPIIRLYLNAYAATGFIFAKIGDLEKAKVITERVKNIDEKRESCATTIFEVLTEVCEEDE